LELKPFTGYPRFADGGQLPTLNTGSGIDYDKLAEVVSGIQIKPVVSVSDISDVSDTITDAKDISGFD
jgi:hypothetical protein